MSGRIWSIVKPSGSASLALGETSSTAYRGDRGKTAYDHSQVASGNPHGTVASDIGYTPTTAADWDGDTDPGHTGNALDQLAERVTDIEEAGVGGGDLLAANNLSDLASASTARTNLGLADAKTKTDHLTVTQAVDLDAMETKLAGIEALADVTDAANVAAAGAIMTSAKGAANGVAELDSSGLVPSAQLPSYVDDVIEAANFAALPGTGATGKIYVTLDDGKTFRWSGSAYVEISASLALGETSSTAYRGDRGKTAYDHSQVASGNPHNVTKSDVGLGNCDNTSDVNKPVSTATQTALDGKLPVQAITTESTTARTLALTDAFDWIHCTHASGCAITVPPQSSVTWVAGTIIYGDQGAAGAVTFVAGSGVTINCADTLVTDGQHSAWALIRISSDVWLLTGRLVAA